MEVIVTDNACLNQTLLRLAANLTDDPARCTSSHQMDHALWLCDGYPNLSPGGSWIGHMLPCLIFLVWSSHWMFGIFREYLELRPGEAYVSLPYHRLLWLPRWVEPTCKWALPPLAVMAELLWAHKGGYRNLLCLAEGDVRHGHFVGNHLGNWSHATMYVGFIISGVVDTAGRWTDLPLGTEKIYLALAFLLEAMLMGLHKKHAPLDILLHTLLTYSMLASSACLLLEHRFPHVFLFSCGRVAAVALQGLWFHAVARISYEGVAAWDTLKEKDAAPVMFAPIYFIMHILGIIAVMSTVFLLMAWTYDHAPLARSDAGGGAAARSGGGTGSNGGNGEGSAAERKGLLAAADEELCMLPSGALRRH